MHKTLKDLAEYFKIEEISTNSVAFRLHSTFTPAIIFALCMIIGFNEYFKEPISCTMDGPVDKDWVKAIQTYCWITTTYLWPDAFEAPTITNPEGNVNPSDRLLLSAHPGIGSENMDSPQKFHAYYQWVSLALFTQGLLFCLPRWLWDSMEGKLLSTVLDGAHVLIKDEKERSKKHVNLVKYLVRYRNQHVPYVMRYWFCEALCFINVVGQMFFLDYFFDSEFLNLGWRIWTLDNVDYYRRTDSLIYIFPRVTKCNFKRYGSSGGVEELDAMCLLPLNMVNEKVYCFLWAWFLILAVLMILCLLYRIFIVLCPCVRECLLISSNQFIPRKIAKTLVSRLNVGDWWMVYSISQNIADPQLYRDVMSDFCKEITSNEEILKL